MSQRVRQDRLFRLIGGVLTAAAATVAGVAVLSLLIMYAGIGDNVLSGLNQALKLISIFLGTLFAVGAGGEKGLLTGAAVGLLYILIGYGLCCLIDGASMRASVLGAECALGGVIGALSGVLVANLPVRRSRART